MATIANVIVEVHPKHKALFVYSPGLGKDNERAITMCVNRITNGEDTHFRLSAISRFSGFTTQHVFVADSKPMSDLVAHMEKVADYLGFKIEHTDR